MESIQTPNFETTIKNIKQYNNLLEIEFNELVNLTDVDLSSIDILTSGGVKCTSVPFTNYITIYKTDGNTVILSNNGNVYVEPEPPIKPEPVEPHEPTEEEIALSLENAKLNKINQLSIACEKTIHKGINIETSLGIEHFSLTLEDQLNITAQSNVIRLGATEVPYHADDGNCRMFSAEEMFNIETNVYIFKVYNTTYFNRLKAWVYRCETVEEINNITYGIALPEDLDVQLMELTGLSSIPVE